GPVEIANVEQGRLRRRKSRDIGGLQDAPRLQYIILENAALAARKMQTIAFRSEKARTLLRDQHAMDTLGDRPAWLAFEIAEDGKQRHQGDEPLLPVDDIELSRRHLR